MTERINLHIKTINRSLIPKLLSNIHFLRTNEYKYLKFDYKTDEFYDLIKDPNENKETKKNHQEIYEKMKFVIEDYIKRNRNPKELLEITTEKEKEIFLYYIPIILILLILFFKISFSGWKSLFI